VQNLKAAAVKNKKFKDCAECPDMVVVPAGSLMMGSPAGETKRVKEHEDQAQVRIAKPFAVGIFAVTRGELGRTADAWRTPQARHRRRADECDEVYGAQEATTVSGRDDVSAQSR
jgi:formylglycine-generating enzyme required for sulfatase activity